MVAEERKLKETLEVWLSGNSLCKSGVKSLELQLLRRLGICLQLLINKRILHWNSCQFGEYGGSRGSIWSSRTSCCWGWRLCSALSSASPRLRTLLCWQSPGQMRGWAGELGKGTRHRVGREDPDMGCTVGTSHSVSIHSPLPSRCHQLSACQSLLTSAFPLCPIPCSLPTTHCWLWQLLFCVVLFCV